MSDTNLSKKLIAKRIKKRRQRTILIAVAFMLVILGLGLKYFTSEYLYNGKIAQNVYIEDVDVSNLTKTEAVNILKEKYPKKDLVLNCEDKIYTLKPEDVDLVYHTEEAVDEAYNFTREGFYFKNIFAYVNAKFNKREDSIKVSFNEENLDKFVEQISKDMNRDFTNASIKISSGVVVNPSQVGLKVDEEANKKEIIKHYNEKSYEAIEVVAEITQPEIKTEDISSIDTMLGAFTTRFNAGKVARTHNIALALARCNGQIIMPGETFSYNDSTGPRSISNGFRNAPVILQGDYADAPGGGVCQGSTTLFNAALLSGLDITEVHSHSKTSSYASRGRDAMVSEGLSDLKFTNNFEHPIYVSCYVGGGTANAAIYGSSKDKVGVSIKTNHSTYSGRPVAVTYRTISKNGKSETSKIYTATYQE